MILHTNIAVHPCIGTGDILNCPLIHLQLTSIHYVTATQLLSIKLIYGDIVIDIIIMSTTMYIVDQVDRLITRASPLALGVLGATSVYYIAFSYGAGVVVLALGKDEATQLFGNVVNNPLVVLVGVPLVPVMLIALEASDVEGR